MKNIQIVFIVVVSIIILTAWNSSTTQLLKVEDIASMQVVGGLASTKPSHLYQSTEEIGKITITKIVDWINSSKPIGGQKEYGKHGYPMVIEIKKNDGKIITIEPAYNCVTKTYAGGRTKTCISVKGEIVLSIDSDRIRAESPELYDWLKEGWKKEK
ncbi:hypothetical protein ACFPYJ_20215 [Paenibacillus solisilvae]|uniref:DUF4309 domain-containing protein n=1 Tax=Paenibacillus solisilvae TaxID=2486751 RepID=A0ABW0W374_9BACL